MYGDGSGGDGDVGHLGGASPRWSCSPARDPRLDRRRRGAPSPNRVSIHFHTRGK